eukprot:6175377-Pleurochrysis_carterae.AAC.3
MRKRVRARERERACAHERACVRRGTCVIVRTDTNERCGRACACVYAGGRASSCQECDYARPCVFAVDHALVPAPA